jgi:hypothetical protein
MAVALMPLDVITTVRLVTTIVTEHHQRRNNPFDHPKAQTNPDKISLLDLPKALIAPAMLAPEAALTPLHRVAEKTTTVVDAISEINKNDTF